MITTELSFAYVSEIDLILNQTHILVTNLVFLCLCNGMKIVMKFFHQSFFFLFLKDSIQNLLITCVCLRKCTTIYQKKSTIYYIVLYTFPLPFNYWSDVVLAWFCKKYFSLCLLILYNFTWRNNKKVKMERLIKKVVWWSV